MGRVWMLVPPFSRLVAVWIATTSSRWSATMSSTPSVNAPPVGPMASSRLQQSSIVASCGPSLIFANGRAGTVRGSRPIGSSRSTSGAKYFSIRTVHSEGL